MEHGYLNFFELLNYGFVQRGIIAGTFIAVLCSVLGMFLVLRKLSLVGDGLAHVTFGSVAVGMLLKVYPFYVAIPLTVMSGVGILKLIQRTRMHGDAAIGVVSSAGVSIGVLVASLAGGFNVDLLSYLFGNILAISKGEMVLSIILSIGVILVVLLYYNQLVSITFDEELAKVSGIKTEKINTLLIMLISLTVVLSMRVVGIMLVSSFLILPNVAALQLAKSFKKAIIFSIGISVFSVVFGIAISFSFNLPTGATIVLTNLLVFLLSLLIKQAKSKA